MSIKNVTRSFRERGSAVIGAILCLVDLIAIIGVNTWWLGPPGEYDPIAALQSWAVTVALIIAFILLVGYGINCRPAGLFIDNRNRVSLSKFQATCWTVLVLSALGTIAAARMRAGIADPLAIDIPGELLVAMGISATSLIATPVLLSLKTAEPATSDQLNSAAAGTGTPRGEAQAAGQLFGRTTPAAARWLDMFRGEDVSNAEAPDLSKIQQFLLTLLILGIYGGGIAAMIAGSDLAANNGILLLKEASLPKLSPHFVWLMGISHASYLAYKVVPHGSSAAAVNAQDAIG